MNVINTNTMSFVDLMDDTIVTQQQDNLPVYETACDYINTGVQYAVNATSVVATDIYAGTVKVTREAYDTVTMNIKNTKSYWTEGRDASRARIQARINKHLGK